MEPSRQRLMRMSLREFNEFENYSIKDERVPKALSFFFVF